MAIPYTIVRLDRRGHVAEVVLDCSEKLNAMTTKFFHEVKAAFEEVDRAPEIRAVVV